MQIKSLVIASVAVAAVSAQQFANNSCTQCVFASFPKDTECAKLTPEQSKNLTNIFANNTPNVPLLNVLVKEAPYQSCLCHWSQEGWKPTGAVGGCISGAAPVCTAADVKEAQDRIAPLAPLLKCGVAKPNGTTSTPPPAATTNKSAATNINLPYALTVAAFGLVALAGF
ncbi:hypothetical protein BG006_003100 [Podila minutissima]|uniref:Secreted protein n=1 Tax=Podila minutissima TaxID=64525 RepID=A0A9P5STW5_9FUNG|nr:hypothetical protein BG006_003100 [Podila minutissima]